MDRIGTSAGQGSTWAETTVRAERVVLRGVALIVSVAFPLWFVVDLLLAPDRWLNFLALRLAAATFALVVAVTARRGQFLVAPSDAVRQLERVRWLSVALGAVTALAAGVILGQSGPDAYPFYVMGYALVPLGWGLAWRWPDRFMAVAQGGFAVIGAGAVAFSVLPMTQFVFTALLLATLGVMMTALSAARYGERRVEHTTSLALSRAESEVAELSASSEAKSAFLSRMSHELRTPLNIVLGYAELVNEDLEAKRVDEAKRDLERIAHASQHLLSLIDDVLELARLEAGRVAVDLRPVAVRPVVEGSLAAHEEAARQRGLELSTSFGEGIGEWVTDATRLGQIVDHLVQNALSFTERGQVTVHAEIDEAGPLLISVVDSGAGIPEDVLERLFEPFAQLDEPASPNQEGFGLGLAIVRHLVQLLGGTIHATSTPGHGSRFEVVLPEFGASHEALAPLALQGTSTLVTSTPIRAPRRPAP